MKKRIVNCGLIFALAFLILSPVFCDNFLFNFSQFEIIYFSNFAQAMKNCYPKNFVEQRAEIKNRDIYRLIELKNDKGEQKIFVYTHGRLMPTELENHWQDYAPLYAESYPHSVTDPSKMSAFQKKLITELGKTETRRHNKPNSFTLVQNFIFNAETQIEIEQELGRITFLGERISVHYKIKPTLARVQAKLENAAKTDWQVRRFLDCPHTITGYNWRQIRDSYQRSAHSWGLSIDCMEAEEIRGSKQIYWRWTKGFYGDDWVETSLKKRWLPPSKVVAIFESEGFIWGGKWELWDNMHFEYRPEILYMQSH